MRCLGLLAGIRCLGLLVVIAGVWSCIGQEPESGDFSAAQLGQLPACQSAEDPRACGILPGCVWRECPAEADCQVPAWCGPANEPLTPGCDAAGNAVECARLRGCVWTEFPPRAHGASSCLEARQPAAPSCESSPASPDCTLERRGTVVVVTDSYRSCETDADCSLVSTSCDGCCQQDAISHGLQRTYQARFREACAGYSGAICDCDVLPAEARCIEAKCALVLP